MPRVTADPVLVLRLAREEWALRLVRAAQGAFAQGHPFYGNQWKGQFIAKSIKTAYGSRYYHLVHGGDWYHIRLSDHPQTSSGDSAQVARGFEDIYAKRANVGMIAPHRLNVVLKRHPNNETEARQAIHKVLEQLPDEAKIRWKENGSDSGNEVDIDATEERHTHSYLNKEGESQFDVIGKSHDALPNPSSSTHASDPVKAAQGAFAAGHKFWGNQWSAHAQDPANDPPGHEPSGKIKHAVLVIGGKRYRGPSHFQALMKAPSTDTTKIEHEGFETESGHFLNREQATHYTHIRSERADHLMDSGDIHLQARDGKLYTQDRVMAANPKRGCLMAMLPSLDSSLPNWAADNIPSSELHEEGIETEPHVTVLYGFDLSFDSSKAGEVLPESVTMTLGKVSRFECPEYDVLKVDVDSPDLERLNRKLAKVFGSEIHKSDHEYHPHLTIAYVKKGACKELDGRNDFRGWQPHVGQLLYSLPEKQGRRVFNLGASAKAVQAADPVQLNAVPHDFSAHEAARSKAEAHYKRAVAKIVAQAEASALAAREESEKRKAERRKRDEEAAALLLLLAGVAAYKAAFKSLAASPVGALGMPGGVLPQTGLQNAPTGLQTPAIGLPGAGQTPVQVPEATLTLKPVADDELEELAEAYAQGREELVKDVPGKVRDALDAELAKPEAAAEDLRELSERLGKVAQRIEDGYGKTVVETETHTAYGHAELRVLQWRGYETKVWQAVGDERTCPTCMSCEERGPLPLGDEFLPGVQAPPAHPNCRCWLTGGSKTA